MMIAIAKLTSAFFFFTILSCHTYADRLLRNIFLTSGLLFATGCLIIFTCDCFIRWRRNQQQQRFASREGKAVLITGCDTGFGHATALYLNAKGFTVFAGCLKGDSDGAAKLRSKCARPERMHVVNFDVRSHQHMHSVYETITKHLSTRSETMHAVINNAGIAYWAPLEWGSMDRDVNPVVDIDLSAVIAISLKFIPLLVRSRESRLIFMTSHITHQPIPYLAAYTVAKNGVKSFADGLRQQVAGDPVYYRDMKILNVLPTAFKTGLTAYDSVLRSFDATWQRTSRDVRFSYGSHLHQGFRNFIHTCRFFEFLDFVAIRSDLNEVAEMFDHLLLSRNPDDETEMISWYTRPFYFLSRTVLPDEVWEFFFFIEEPLLRLFSVIGSLVN